MNDSQLIEAQKETASHLLRTLSETLKTREIYLAGGMLREHYFNRPGNDYDIYAYTPEISEDFILPLIRGVEGFEDFDYKEQHIEEDFDEECYSWTDYNSILIDFILEGSYEGEIVQLIFLKRQPVTPRDYIEHGFAVNISKIWQTPHNSPVFTEQFVQAVTEKYLVFNWDFAGKVNYAYIRKIMNRFPDFDVDENTIGNLNRNFALAGYL